MDDGGPTAAKSPEWAQTALDACLRQLPVDTIAYGKSVQVLRAWTEAGTAFCVVYRYQCFDGVLGIRCTFDEDMYGELPDSPEDFGCDIAVYAIGEPLGTVADRLRVDESGVHWWGDLDEHLPRPPAE